MATKSKKTSQYLTRTKIFAAMIYFIGVLTLYLSSMIFLNISQNWKYQAVATNSYYETQNFRTRFDKLLSDVINVSVYFKDEKSIEAGEHLSKEDLLTSFKNYYSVIDGVITQSTEVNDTYDGLIIKNKIPENLQSNFEEYKTLVETRLYQYRNMYIQNQLEVYRNMKRELNDYENFFYYLEDENGNKISGNISKEGISNMTRSIILEGGFSIDNLGYYTEYHDEVFEKSGCKLYAAIREPLLPGDAFYREQEEFYMIKRSYPILTGVAITACIAIIISLLYLIRVAGQSQRGGDIEYLVIDRIYNDIHIILFTIFNSAAGFITLLLCNVILYNSTYYLWTYIFSTLLGALLILYSTVWLSFMTSLSRQIKGKRFFSNTMVAAILRKISYLFSGKTFCGWIVFLLMGYGMANCIMTMFLLNAILYGTGGIALFLLFCMLLFNGIAAAFCARALGSLTKVMISVKETSKGNFAYELDLKKISPSFKNFAEDVANIQCGLREAVEEAVKGERMKAELITNVSHDLKTPLTSIITYVDLLKKETLDNEKAKEFVEVLHEKSYRLKQLIEDLIEASKASSGNLTVTKGKVDLKLLFMQAIGELEEKIEKAGLTIKINCEQETIIYADGRHMWRILENLITNVIKYSMPNSRVYVDIFHMNDMGVMIIKNISAASIDITPDQLMDRFVRGDVSRTTEGSGLGLSIAKSLSEIQDGKFEINIDGDLFKAIVMMPIWIEYNTEESEKQQE